MRLDPGWPNRELNDNRYDDALVNLHVGGNYIQDIVYTRLGRKRERIFGQTQRRMSYFQALVKEDGKNQEHMHPAKGNHEENKHSS